MLSSLIFKNRGIPAQQFDKSSNDGNTSYWFAKRDYLYSGNAYQWWMLPAGSRKMNNGNQAYHNTETHTHTALYHRLIIMIVNVIMTILIIGCVLLRIIITLHATEACISAGILSADAIGIVVSFSL